MRAPVRQELVREEGVALTADTWRGYSREGSNGKEGAAAGLSIPPTDTEYFLSASHYSRSQGAVAHRGWDRGAVFSDALNMRCRRI